MKKRVYVRVDPAARKYELMVNDLKVLEFVSAVELHLFLEQGLATLRYSLGKDFARLDE